MDKSKEYFRDLRNYVVGFVLSLVLSGAAFWLVLAAGLSKGYTMIAVGILGVTQLVVQLKYFLHIDTRRENREDLYLILFSTLVLLIVVLGTVWILGSLANRMQMQM